MAKKLKDQEGSVPIVVLIFLIGLFSGLAMESFFGGATITTIAIVFVLAIEEAADKISATIAATKKG